jgi:hypothetical protein
MLLLQTNQALLDLLNAGTAGAPTTGLGLGTVSINLYNQPVPLTAQTPLGSCTTGTPTYSGYGAVTASLAAADVSQAGYVETISGSASFAPNSSVVTDNIYGLFVTGTGADSTHLLFVANFDTKPIPMTGPTSVIRLNLAWQPSNGGGLVIYIT